MDRLPHPSLRVLFAVPRGFLFAFLHGPSRVVDSVWCMLDVNQQHLLNRLTTNFHRGKRQQETLHEATGCPQYDLQHLGSLRWQVSSLSTWMLNLVLIFFILVSEMPYECHMNVICLGSSCATRCPLRSPVGRRHGRRAEDGGVPPAAAVEDVAREALRDHLV